MKPSGAATRWHFGPAELDEGTFELRLDGRLLDVERKPVEVLLCLLRHGNEIVSKEQLQATVWPGRIVSESVLTKCIAKLRDALKDDRQTLIKTQHGFGYRLAVPVRAERSAAHEIQFDAAPRHDTALPAAAVVAAAEVPAFIAATSASRRQTSRLRIALSALAAATALAVLLWFVGNERATPSVIAKTVAVLPFANLSGDADNAYFTEGLHDSILTHLALIQDLSVISRTSVMQYREGVRNLRQIARTLGVANIVEGSVQRSGNRLRVTAQLIDTRTDTHLWAGQFDRNLSDVFVVQAEIAQQIAGAIQVRLTPEEKGRIERKPTENTAAYELYLRALEVARRAEGDRVEIDAAIAQIEQAVTLDPAFALAYALLSGLHDSLYWPGIDASDARRGQVRDAAQTALRLDPELPEAHIAMGRYLYHGTRDYTAAIQALERARALAPGDAQVPFWLGAIYRRQGRWEESAASFEQAALVDPRNEQVLAEYGFTLQALKRYAESDALYARLEAFAKKPETIRIKRGFLHLTWTGDLGRLERALAGLSDAPKAGCNISFDRWQLRVLQRRFDEAVAEVLACQDEYAAGGDAGAIPKFFFAAAAKHMGGDPAAARPLFQQARAALEKRLRNSSNEPTGRVALAHSLLAVGERGAAFAQVQRALDEMPLSKDAVTGAFVMTQAAGFYAMAGQTTQALDLLERSLSLPSGEYVHAMERNPIYDPLRNEPRYKELVARYLKAESS